LFGFREVRTTAGIVAGLIEVAAFAALVMAAVAAGPARQADAPAIPAAAMPAQVQAAAPMMVAAVGAVSVLALALLGVAVAHAGGPPAAVVGAGVTSKTAKVGGVTVLTSRVTGPCGDAESMAALSSARWRSMSAGALSSLPPMPARS
jgi:hypothetical protein